MFFCILCDVCSILLISQQATSRSPSASSTLCIGRNGGDDDGSHRGEVCWKVTSRRRSSRLEVPLVPRGSLLGGGTTHGAFSGGFNDDGSAAAAAAAAAASATAATTKATAAAHVPAPWFPPLVQKIETRKNETAQRLIRTQGKVRQAVALQPARFFPTAGGAYFRSLYPF